MRFFPYLALLGILSLVACDKQEAMELPNASNNAVQYDTSDFKDFDELLAKIESESVGKTATYEVRHGAEQIEVKVAPLPPELCPALVSIKGEVIRSGADLKAIDLKKLKEMLGFMAQGGEAAGTEPGIQLFADDGASMDTGVSVLRAMSEKSIQLWLSTPQKQKPAKPMVKKPSSPTSDVSRILTIDRPDESP